MYLTQSDEILVMPSSESEQYWDLEGGYEVPHGESWDGEDAARMLARNQKWGK